MGAARLQSNLGQYMDVGAADVELVRASLDGDGDAFAELTRRHWDRVYAIGFAKTTNHMDAADVAQETFLRAYARLRQMKRLDVFRAWVCRIAWSIALDTLRRRTREAPAQENDVWAEIRDDRDAHLATEEAIDARSELAPALRSLPEELRTPLVMRYMADASYESIAESLCISLTNAHTRVARAKARLREHFARRGVAAPSDDAYRSLLVAAPAWQGIHSAISGRQPDASRDGPYRTVPKALTAGLLGAGMIAGMGGLVAPSARPRGDLAAGSPEAWAPPVALVRAPTPMSMPRAPALETKLLVRPGSELVGWVPGAPQHDTAVPVAARNVMRSPPFGAVLVNPHGVARRFEAIEGVVVIEMWIRPPLGAYNTMVQAIFDDNIEDGVGMVFKNETDMWGYGPDNYTSEYVAPVLQRGHDLKIVYRTVEGSFDFYLDGVRMAEGVQRPKHAGRAMTGIYLTSGHGDDRAPTYFDDLRVTALVD